MIKIKYESAKITMIIHVHVHVGLMLVKIFLWEPMSKTFSHCWFIYNIMWLRNDLIIVLNKVFLIIKALLYNQLFCVVHVILYLHLQNQIIHGSSCYFCRGKLFKVFIEYSRRVQPVTNISMTIINNAFYMYL